MSITELLHGIFLRPSIIVPYGLRRNEAVQRRIEHFLRALTLILNDRLVLEVQCRGRSWICKSRPEKFTTSCPTAFPGGRIQWDLPSGSRQSVSRNCAVSHRNGIAWPLRSFVRAACEVLFKNYVGCYVRQQYPIETADYESLEGSAVK